ncbi:MAG: hypothetical protein [Caudoviricetes sp.]|nr:MAG: hypothetical protein [Caudoviricetes sp.]
MPVSTRVPQGYRGVPSDVWKEVFEKISEEDANPPMQSMSASMPTPQPVQQQQVAQSMPTPQPVQQQTQSQDNQVRLPDPIPFAKEPVQDKYVTVNDIKRSNEELANAILNGLQRSQPQSAAPATPERPGDNSLDDLSKFNFESFSPDEVKELVPLIRSVAQKVAPSTPRETIDENKIINKVLSQLTATQQMQQHANMDTYLDKTQAWAVPYKQSRQFADFLSTPTTTVDGIRTRLTYGMELDRAYKEDNRQLATDILQAFKKNLENEANSSKLNVSTVVEPTLNAAPVMVATTPAKEEQPVTVESIMDVLSQLDAARRGHVDRAKSAKMRANLERMFKS